MQLAAGQNWNIQRTCGMLRTRYLTSEMIGFKRRFVRVTVAFTPEDDAAFHAALLAEFPGLQVLPRSEWLYMPPGVSHLYPQAEADLKLNYLDRIDDYDRTNQFMCWLEPDGWEPIWVPVRPGQFTVVNPPPKRFAYISRAKHCARRSDVLTGQIIGWHRVDDPETRRFLRRVEKVVQSISSNVMDYYHPFSRSPQGKARQEQFWAGLHALEWCRDHPERWIDGSHRPPGG